MPINVMDAFVILVLLVSAILAYARGFVHEILSLGGWLGAIAITVYGLPYAQPYARQWIEKDILADLATGVVLFVASLFILSFLTSAISERIRKSALGALDRALGFLFGIARGAVLICLVYLGIVWVWPDPEEQPAWLSEARATPMMVAGGEMLKSLVPEGALEEEKLDELAREAKEMLETQETIRNILDVKPSEEPESPPGQEGGYTEQQRRAMGQSIEGIGEQ